MKKIVNTPKLVKVDNQEKAESFYLQLSASLLSAKLKG
jgi:hypothetical protein